jgi:hypothetical protein
VPRPVAIAHYRCRLQPSKAMISIHVAGSRPREGEEGRESKKVSRVETRQVGFHVAAGAKKNKQKNR